MNKLCRTYQIAGIGIAAKYTEDWKIVDDGVLKDYVSEVKNPDLVIECELVDELTHNTGEVIYYDERKHIVLCEGKYVRYDGHSNDIQQCYARLVKQDGKSFVQVRSSEIVSGIPSHLMLELFELEHLLAKRNGILLHASVICINKEAIVFTAPSQTGKSTQARLWNEVMDAEIINGDRCAVCVEQSGVFVHGIPFAGSSGIRKNVRLPLKAIVYLSQALENNAQLCHGASAFRRVYEGCSVQLWHQKDVECVMDTIEQILNCVPVIHFACTKEKESVYALKRMLEGRNHEKTN